MYVDMCSPFTNQKVQPGMINICGGKRGGKRVPGGDPAHWPNVCAKKRGGNTGGIFHD